MREIEIRRALRLLILREFADRDTRVVDELAICEGAARIDMAAVNGSLHGYEIKSAQDTLQRLSDQSVAYSRIFDFVTLVTAKRHLRAARVLLPKWWGILVVEDPDKIVTLRQVRRPKRNRGVDAYSQAQLLWRDEALAILDAFNLARGIRSKPRRQLCERLVANLDIDMVADAVRRTLKNRQSWRVDALPASNGDSCPLFATS